MFTKPILMIHEFREEYLSLPLEDYILTFDDGLYTQYLFLDELRKIDTIKIFSISTKVVSQGTQNKEFINCFDARKKANKNNYENYMTWEQIQDIHSYTNCFIAGHSHSHKDIRKIKKLNDLINFINSDTIQMLKEFKLNLDFIPDMFCFPFNQDNKFYKGILRTKYNFNRFLGSERIDIEDLL